MPSPTQPQFDILILGATPAGIAARLGRAVALIEPHHHVGGMSAAGLGKSDIENRAMIRGLFLEFTQRIRRHYINTFGPESENTRLARDGYFYEPSVAESIFRQMLDEQPAITLLTGHRLESAHTDRDTLHAVDILNTRDGQTQTFTAHVFIDATYEGDLYAAAGAQFRLGRESRDQHDEPHAGVVYFEYQNRRFLPGTTGRADDDLPACTYRLCLATDPDNAHHLTEPPPGYDRADFVGYFDDLESGRLAGPKNFKPGRGYFQGHFNTMVRALSISQIPNHKTDVNINPRPLAFPFPEENRHYINADPDTRQNICARHRALALGLLWFIQNDPDIPADQRAIANQYHLPKDEFTDNDHFPFQLYVREGRRLLGEFTITEHDITDLGDHRAPRRHADSIATGEFPIDSFPCRKRQPHDTIVLEGYLGMLDHITRPYQIPYRIMIPKRIDRLIVPVAASTTHVAYSSIRMEPTWMALGQAAGNAAHLAITRDLPPRHVPIDDLQHQLTTQGQVISPAI